MLQKPASARPASAPQWQVLPVGYRREGLTVGAIFALFLRLGCTSFGGPTAHIAYFYAEFVERRQWLSAHAYAQLVALCQFLPGPASSQVGMALAYSQGGARAALAAWLGFTLPSALCMTGLALWMQGQSQVLVLPAAVGSGLMQGLKIVTLAVVAQAVWSMARSVCRTSWQWTMMLVCTGVLWAYSAWWLTPLLILLAAAVSLLQRMFGPRSDSKVSDSQPPLTAEQQRARRTGGWLLLLLALSLLVLPLLARSQPSSLWSVADAFFRTGAWVFGGGHVVLPFLQAELVRPGGVQSDVFLAGYAAAQALPGPLFAFAAFVGAALPSSSWADSVLQAGVALVAIFLPAALWLFGAWPFWHLWRMHSRLQAAMAGASTAMVAVLLATWLGFLWPSTVHTLGDVLFAVLALTVLQIGKWPPWLVVLMGAVAGAAAGAVAAGVATMGA